MPCPVKAVDGAPFAQPVYTQLGCCYRNKGLMGGQRRVATFLKHTGEMYVRHDRIPLAHCS